MKKLFSLYLLSFLFLSACSSSGGDDGPAPIDDDGPVQVDRSQNLLATGASANDLLSNVNFDRLLIQIGFVPGFRPTDQTVDNFLQYIQDQTFKQNIEVDFLELDSPGEETLTLQEIANLETENRTAYNDGTTLAVYIYFADAPSDGDDEDQGLVTLGAVYRNTSMIIFESTIRRLAARSLLITTTDVETATLNHEFGHLFGLVNLGTVAVNEHEDIIRDANGNPVLDDNGNEQGNNHCNVDGCLMQAQLTFGSPMSRALSAATKEELVSACSLSGNSLLRVLENQASRGLAVVPVLDPECVLDLQNNGGR
ncbi:MAG: hypothetical protein AAF039_18730 [Bacteroidota bacterium]